MPGRLVLLIVFSLSVAGQDLIETIMDRNPFDPDRGHNKEELLDNQVELVPDDLPLCDGTFILGENRYALFTFMIEGKPVPKTMQVNDTSNGYKVTSIEYNQVILEQGSKTHTIKLFFQESKMDNRGGSRNAVAKRAKPSKKSHKTSKTKSHGRKGSMTKLKPSKRTNKSKSSRPTIVKKPSKKNPKPSKNKKDF